MTKDWHSLAPKMNYFFARTNSSKFNIYDQIQDHKKDGNAQKNEHLDFFLSAIMMQSNI